MSSWLEKQCSVKVHLPNSHRLSSVGTAGAGVMTENAKREALKRTFQEVWTVSEVWGADMQTSNGEVLTL